MENVFPLFFRSSIGELEMPKRDWEMTHHKEYIPAILRIITFLGGVALARDVVWLIPLVMDLKPKDYERLRSGNIRYMNNTRWARNFMANEVRWLYAPSHGIHGEWRLTPQGVRAAEELPRLLGQ